MKKYFILIVCSLLFMTTAQAQFPSKTSKEGEKKEKKSIFGKKKDKSQVATPAGGSDEESSNVLRSGGFEGFQEEGTATTQKPPKVKQANPNTFKNAFRRSGGGRGKGNFKADKSNLKEKPTGNPNNDIIRVNTEVLYGGKLSTHVVEGERIEPTFKEEQDNKYYYNQALLKLNSNDHEAALEFLNKCMDVDPNDKEYLQLRGNVYTELGKYRKAVADFQQALSIDEENPVLHYNLGSTYAKMGKMDDAITSFSGALERNPEYLLARQGRAAAYTITGNYDTAINDFNDALDQNMFFTPAVMGRGISKSLLSRYDEGISDFSNVIESDPDNGLAYYYRGLAYCSNKQMYKGCADLEKAHQMNIPQAYEEIKAMCR